MKRIAVILLSGLLHLPAIAQPDMKIPERFDVAVSFGSMCCGPASDTFLRSYIKQFNLRNKATVQAWQSGGCGREGEFKVLFSLGNLKPHVRERLLADLKKLVSGQNDKNKMAKATSGPVSLGYNMPASELSDCRCGLTKWK